MKVYILNTCVPNESKPCVPHAYSTLGAADSAFAAAMKAEWDSNPPYDDETGEPMRFPADPRLTPFENARDAHDTLADYHGHEWGRWDIFTIELDEEFGALLNGRTPAA